MKTYILSLTILLTSVLSCFAQQDTLNLTDSTMVNKKVLILLSDKDELRGTYVKEDQNFVFLESEIGEIKVNKSKIESIKIDDYTGRFKYPNPHDSRYFFGPTAIPIKKGMGYYQNLYVVGNFVNVGITRNLSIGGGFEFISTFIAREPIIFFTPKVGFELDPKFHLGGGVLVAGLAGNFFTLGYGVATYGTSESNITFGVGYGIQNNELNQYPTFMLSGQHRVSNGVSLMTENYLISTPFSTQFIGCQGVRLLARKNAFDIGLVIIPELISEGIPLPFVGYTRVFGRERPSKFSKSK